MGLRTHVHGLVEDPITRRYFISNGFDGTLTSIGVVVGAFLSGVPSGLTVIAIGLGAAVGLGTSGVWSVWEIERAEKRIERMDVEDAMLRSLEGTRVATLDRERRIENALFSGLGPLIGVVVPISPFALEGVTLTMVEATVLGVAAGVALLFVLGAYLGNLSRQTWYVAGVRMAIAGLVVAMINLALPA